MRGELLSSFTGDSKDLKDSFKVQEVSSPTLIVS